MRAARYLAAAMVIVPLAGEAAWADCSPPPADGVTSTCTGTTIDQGASFSGYGGDGTEIGVTVNVESGATVQGGTYGIIFGDGTVTNGAGAHIEGGTYGILANYGSLNLTNSGSIAGDYAVIASTNVTVINNAGASITGGTYGIYADAGGSSVFNAGAISGGTAAIQFGGSGNTLTLAKGSVITGSVIGTGDDTLQLGGTEAATFDVSTLTPSVGDTKQYVGFSNLNKIDSSTWTLTGNGAYDGFVDVKEGVLLLQDAKLKAQYTTVESGAQLIGMGTNSLGGGVTVMGGGIFGNQSPTSTIKMASLMMATGAYYYVSLNPSQSSSILVTGTATLDGATVQANFASSNYINHRYTILTAGQIEGEFKPETVNTGLAGIKTSLSYNTEKTVAYLDLEMDSAPPSGPSGSKGGANSNQGNVQNAISNYFNTHTGMPGAFVGLSSQSLTQVSGEVGTSAQGTTAQANTQFMNVLGDVTSAGRGFAAGAGGVGGAMGYADESMAYAAKKKSSDPRDAFASFNKAPPAVFAPRWSVWAMGFGGSQTTDGNVSAGTNTASSNIYGAAVGADYRVGLDTVAGFALAGGGTNYSIVNGGTGRSDLFQAGAFVRQNFGATYLTASAAYGWQDVTTDRYVTVAGSDHLRAEFNTNSYSGRLELGHRFLTPWIGGLGVSPYAAAEVTAFELPSYAEHAVSGAGTFALNYNGETSTATRSELGVRTDKSYALEGAMLTLRGRAAWAHNFDPDSAVTATFQSLPGASFLVNGAKLASESAHTTASAELSWTNGWSIAGTFEGEFSDVTRSYAGKGVVRYNW